MNIALAQMDVKLGQIEANFVKLTELLLEAKAGSAHLVVFPEMCLTGYILGDKWTDDSFCRRLSAYDQKIRELSRELDLAIIYGNLFLDTSKTGHDGRKARYNAAYCCESGDVQIRFKTLLPSYRVFDDSRYFLSGGADNIAPVLLKSGVKIGLEVCEDMWWEDYGVNVSQILIERGAKFIVNISASPFSAGKNTARDNRIKNIEMIASASVGFVPFFYLNCTGVQNNGKNIITFDGDSRAYNRKGEKIETTLKPYEEGIIRTRIYEGDVIGEKAALVQNPPIEQKYNAIIRAYKGIDEMLGYTPPYIFGLSGGIDSAVSASLAVLSLGAHRVKGYNLPSKYNTPATKDAAKQTADSLGIAYKVIPIDKFMEAAAQTLGNLPSAIEENIQARLRGNILMTLAAIENGVVVSNANKVETALGYCTLYGDTVGVFSPLGDLTKIEIWEMARFINQKNRFIPETLIPDENFRCAVMPSAELKENQTDPMKWGYHDKLLEAVMNYKKTGKDDIISWYEHGILCTKLGISETLFKNYGLNDPKVFADDLERFMNSMQKGVFKRLQSPPILILSKSAFGYDFRESQFACEHLL
ncbi:MAG: NAD(+) synthase [Deferribacteraceae bacterium]|jgi:NAD+ synthase (glutamine-hydrolysing)|nr:NAD(+) synthase [Deferribacteraceae bacterium]